MPQRSLQGTRKKTPAKVRTRKGETMKMNMRKPRQRQTQQKKNQQQKKRTMKMMILRKKSKRSWNNRWMKWRQSQESSRFSQ